MKSSEVELWKGFYFIKAKRYHKVFSFGSKSSYMGTHGKYNSNNKVEAIVFIHVCNESEMIFWFF